MGEVYYSSSSRTAWRTWEWRLLPWSGFLVLSEACGMWGRDELAFSPDSAAALITQGVHRGPGCPRAGNPQPPSAPSQSGVPEMRTKSLACSHSPQHRPNRNPGSFLLSHLTSTLFYMVSLPVEKEHWK